MSVGRQRWARIVAITVMTVLPLTGCYDRQELEQQAFVVTMGIDKAPDGLQDYTFRIALPQNPASGGGKGSDQPLAGSGPVTFRAHSITEALTLANTSVERAMSVTHLGQVVIGEDLAKAGLNQTLQDMVRFREFRPGLYLILAKGKARDIISSDKPVLEQSPSRMADSLASIAERTGLVPVVHLHDVLTSGALHHGSMTMAQFAVNESVKSDPKGKKPIEGQDIAFQAGQVKRQGGNPVEWMGAAVFRGDKWVSSLNGQECIMLQILKGDLKSTNLTLPSPDGQGVIGLTVKREHAPRYQVSMGDPLVISVGIPLEADVTTSQSTDDLTNPQVRQRLETYTDKLLNRNFTQFLQKLLNQNQADVIPISDRIRGNFSTHEAYASYPWEQKLKTAQISANVDLNIRRYGVQMTPLRTHT